MKSPALLMVMALGIFITMALAACQPTIRYQDRLIDRPVPYPVYCADEVPAAPVYITEELRPGASDGVIIMSLYEETKQRARFTDTLIELLLNCVEG